MAYEAHREPTKTSAKTLLDIEQDGFEGVRWANGTSAGRFVNPYLPGTNDHAAYERGVERGKALYD